MLARFWSGEFSAGGGPLTRLFSQRAGGLLAYGALRFSQSPNLLTVMGLAVSILASVVFASSTLWTASLWSLLLYQLAYALDCADGQLARATGKGSEFGAWLDVNCDAAGVLFMAFALIYFFHSQDALSLNSLLSVALITLGRIVHLYSVPAVKVQAPGTSSLASGRVKTLLWLLIDTPFFYLWVCVLHSCPDYLVAYLLLMGGVYGLTALNNVRRLSGAPFPVMTDQESER